MLNKTGHNRKAAPDATSEAGRRASISACMIVKNEEYFLPRCLRSIRDLVDEIVLVDTGSDDRTVEIAEEFDCKIYHFPWTGDFSAARNESLKQAASDWILIIDADEEIPAEDISKYRSVVEYPDFQIVSISVYNRSPETGEVSSFLPSVRLFRRNLGLEYTGIVHNRLKIPADIPKIRADLRLFHYGYNLPREQQDKKLERTRLLLEKQLQDNPDDLFANFNMIQLLRSLKDSHRPEITRRVVAHADRVIDNHEAHKPMYFGHRLMALYKKAAALALLREYDEAERCCREALEAKPNYLDPIMTLGHIYNNTGRLDEAKACYHRFLDMRRAYRPENETHNIVIHNLDFPHHAWFALADIAERENRTDEAIRIFHKVFESKEPYLDAYCRLGRLYLDKQELKRAGEMFAKEVARDESSAPAHFGLGSVCLAREDNAGAVEHLQKAVERAPGNPLMRYYLGRTLISLGNQEEGKRHLREGADLAATDPGFIFETANLFFQVGDMKTAAELYNQTLALQPNHGDALNNLGNCHFKTGQFEKACAKYEQLMESFPEYYTALRNLGLARMRLDQPDPARAALTRYAEVCPEDIAVCRVLGDICYQKDCFDEAVTWYEKYLPRNPRDHEVLLRLAEAYRGLGFTDSAILGYRQVLALSPDCELAKNRLGEPARFETAT